MDIVIFHNIHHPKSWALVTNPEVANNEAVEIIDWFGDIEGRDEWIANNPGVGPTVFPTIWIKSPAYMRPNIIINYLDLEKEEAAALTYESWETPGVEELFVGTFSYVPERWEMVYEQDIEWDEVLARLQFYKDRADYTLPKAE